jgi:hypothetical protein
MSVILICLLSVLLAGAQGPNWGQAIYDNLLHERVAGLLTLPEIVGNGCDPSQSVATISIYASPSTEGRPPIGSLERSRDPGCQLLVKHVGQDVRLALPTAESSYEIPAAVVYERRGRWFRIALQRGSAWIDRRDPGDFRPYPALLKKKLAYLQPKWDGTLRQAPNLSATLKRLSPGWKEHFAEPVPIELLAIRRVSGETWLHVRLRVESCGEVLKGVKPVEGWVPAHRSSGRPNAWFFSRGC